jgi:proton translocating ATP synthase F1 alpha subunit
MIYYAFFLYAFVFFIVIKIITVIYSSYSSKLLLEYVNINLQKNIKINYFFNDKDKKIKKHNINKKSLYDFKSKLNYQNAGFVLSVSDGVAVVFGLFNISLSELVIFENGLKGMALNLETNQTGIVIFGNDFLIRQGFTVTRLNCIVNISVGFSILGRVVNSLGEFIDSKNITTTKITPYKYNINAKAPGIIARESVREPLQTGLKAIDSMVPIGKGQRELIIGDRQTGKTTVSIDTILNQKYNNFFFDKNTNIFCIYIAIGQKRSIIAKIVNYLKKVNSLFYTIFVCSTASEAASLQFLAPYAGCSLGE